MNSVGAQTVAEFNIMKSVFNVCTVSDVEVKLTDLTPNESYRFYFFESGIFTFSTIVGYPDFIEDPNWQNGGPTLYIPFTATSADQILKFKITPKVFNSSSSWPFRIGWETQKNARSGYLTTEADPSQNLSFGWDNAIFFANELLNAMPNGFGPYISSSNEFNDFKLNNNSVINLNKFYIDDKMVINETLELVGQSNIYFGPNGSLEIAENNTFRVKGSEFQNACDESWKGIELKSGAQMVIEGAAGQLMSRSVITGARIGINSQNSSGLFCYNTDFKNNYIGINHEAASSTFILDISNCKFFGMGTLPISEIPIPELESGTINFEQIQPYAGVRLCNNTNYNVFTEGTNQFYNMENGIILKNSSGDFSNCKFRNIQHKYIADNENSGYAIIARDPNPYGASSLFYSGLNNAQTPDFKDCDFGIITRNYGLDLSNTQMKSILTIGAEASSGTLKLSRIVTNNITAGLNSIRAHNNFLSSIEVGDNYLFVNSGSQGASACVDLASNINSANLINGSVMVSNNHIHNYGQGVGIRSLNDELPVIKDNFITANDKTYGDGIRIDNSFASYISCNYLTQPSIFTAGQQASAIRTFMSPNSYVQCNNENNYPRGYTFLGISTASTIRGNSIYQNETGLLYDLEAMTGLQPNTSNPNAVLHGNTWNGYSFADKGARHRSTSAFLIDQSRYTNDNQIFGNSTSVITGNPLSAWFVDDSGFDSFECEDEIPALECGTLGPITPISPRSDSTDIRIADGGIESDVYPDSYRWIGERQLYKKLNLWPSLVPSTTIFPTFYANNTNTTIGKLSLMEKHIKNVSLVPNMSPLAIKQKLFTIDSLEDVYRVLMAQPNPSQQLVNQLRNAIQSNRSQLDQETSGYNTVRELRIQNLNTLNNAIGTSDLYEANEKTVNNIMLEYLLIGEAALDSVTMVELIDIANQCPLIGGLGVFNARSLVNKKLSIEWDDYDLCEVIENRESITSGSSLESNSLIFPNPVDLNLNIRMAVSKTADYLIYDMRGVVCLKGKIGSGEPINVANLNSGMYIAEIKMEDGEIHRVNWIKQ